MNTAGDANPHPNLEHYYDRDTDRLAIDAHLASCGTCRASLAKIHERLRDLECRELVELVTEYLDEVAEDPLRRRIEDHLRLCEGCRSYVEQIQSTISTIGRTAPAPEPPEPVRTSLLAVFRAWRNGRPAKPE